MMPHHPTVGGQHAYWRCEGGHVHADQDTPVPPGDVRPAAADAHAGQHGQDQEEEQLAGQHTEGHRKPGVVEPVPLDESEAFFDVALETDEEKPGAGRAKRTESTVLPRIENSM